MHCHVHPHKIARRKCCHCKKPLCPRCQILVNGLIFCGSFCRWKYFLNTPRQLPTRQQIASIARLVVSFVLPILKAIYLKLKPTIIFLLSLLERELCYGEERAVWELKANRDSIKYFWTAEKEGLRRITVRAQRSFSFILAFSAKVIKALIKGLIHFLRSQIILAKDIISSLYFLICLLSVISAALIGDFLSGIVEKLFNLIYEYIIYKYRYYKDLEGKIKNQWWAKAFARALLLILILLVFSLSRSVMKAHMIYENLMSEAYLALNSPYLYTSSGIKKQEMLSPEGSQVTVTVPISTARPSVNSKLSYAPDIRRVSTGEKVLAITFDGGAEANVTAEILKALRDKNIRTTIFLTGEYMKKYPSYVQRMVQEGHEIGNHTLTHPHLTTYARNRRHDLIPSITKQYFQKELTSTNEVFRNITGRNLWPYWRAPYGEHNATLRAWAQELGYQHISWTVDYQNQESMDSVDWVADKKSRLYRSSEEIKNRLISFGERNGHGAKGGIILMHLGTLRQEDKVHERLEEIIEAFRQKGYRLLTITELLQKETPIKTASPQSSSVNH